MQISDETIEKCAEYLAFIDGYNLEMLHDLVEGAYAEDAREVLKIAIQSGEVVLRSDVDELVDATTELQKMATRVAILEGRITSRSRMDNFELNSITPELLIRAEEMFSELKTKLHNLCVALAPFKLKAGE